LPIRLYTCSTRPRATELPETRQSYERGEVHGILLYRLLFHLLCRGPQSLAGPQRRYDEYGLRDKVRGDIGRRKDANDTFSDSAARYWSVIDDLCRAINGGDMSIGLPPYNGGLFDPDRTPLLSNIRLPDTVIASVTDALSFEHLRRIRRPRLSSRASRPPGG
jgi:hypothetical protein